MKRAFLFAIGGFMASIGLAQTASLPTSFNFETAPSVLPDGWSTNTDNFYTTGNSGLAGKLDDVDDNYTVHVNDEPGMITMYLRTFGSGDHGEFSVEESQDGNTWTDIPGGVFGNGDIDAEYDLYTVMADRDSRWIRFNYDTDQTGTNVGIDDVTIQLAPPPAEAEINITNLSNTTIPSGASHTVQGAMSNTQNFDLYIKNLGTDSMLTIDTVMLSGVNAADFAITSWPTSVGTTDSAMLSMSFTPGAMGSRFATVTIVNNDGNENPYTVELYGIGGDFATEPTNQPTGLVFAGVTSYKMDALFSGASNTDGYIVLRQHGSAVTDVPVDGMDYQVGDMVGSAKVAFVGENATVSLKDIIANRDVHLAVFSYNGPTGYKNYLTTAPLTGNQAASDNMMGNYYAALGPNPTPAEIFSVIDDHTFTFYSNYTTLLINDFYARDTTGGANVVTCQYSGEENIYAATWDWTDQDYAREHCFPRSWMPPDGSTGTDEEEGADYHNLFPVKSAVNNQRSNHQFGDQTSSSPLNVDYSFLEATLYEDPNNFNPVTNNRIKYFEPRDEHKGDVARAHFYMLTRYHFRDGEDWTSLAVSTYLQDYALLKSWHDNDPPSNFEISRNDLIQTFQDNRNPYIDNPAWADNIDFSTMTPTGVAESSSLSELSAFPNPTSDILNVSFILTESGSVQLNLTDLTGKAVMTERHAGNNGYNKVVLDTQALPNGIYLLEVTTNSIANTYKVVIQ